MDRIGFHGRVEDTLETFQQLHRAHLHTIPYENIEIRLGRKVSLDTDDGKIVVNGRGGYCYELNSLFAWLLRQIGFEVQLLSARLLSFYSDGNPGPEYEHLVLKFKAGDNWWLADVGHGEVFEMPMPLMSGIEQSEPLGDMCLLQTVIQTTPCWRN
nr:arylamine N-acetyltransferase [Sansalvadorimonas sp. 2012CJ34-2]